MVAIELSLRTDNLFEVFQLVVSRISLLRTRVYCELKGTTFWEGMSAGNFLFNRVLAKQLDMSPAPIHLVLDRLEAGGGEASLPNGGLLLGNSYQRDCQFLEFRLAIESFVIRSVTDKLTPDQRSRLGGNFKAQAAVQKNGDLDAFVQEDVVFNHLICECLGSIWDLVSGLINRSSGWQERLTCTSRDSRINFWSRMTLSFGRSSRVSNHYSVQTPWYR